MQPIGISAIVVLVCLAIVVLIHRHWLLRRITYKPERLNWRSGRFQHLELEILGAPPEVPELEKRESAGDGDEGKKRIPPEFSPPSSRPEELTGFALGAAAPADAVLENDYLWAWHHVDQHLFPAVEQMTHHSVHSVADLSHAIYGQGWKIDPWHDVSKHLVNNVKGHVAEWLAGDHLQHAGIPVHMAASSNLPGMDLWAAGQPLNVKSYADVAHALRDHFARYPDIAALVNVDAAHIPPEALHFDPSHGFDPADLHHAGHFAFVDDALSNADVTHATRHGLDVAAGHAHIHLHIPWITMAISGIRELRLLYKGATDLQRALKNVAVDTATVGGGAAIGAKTGAAIGSAIAPGVGTLIGTVLGGVTGAVLGRLAANKIKQAPLREATQVYEATLQKFKAGQEEERKQADRQWSTFSAEQQTWLAKERDTAEQEARDAIRRAQNRLRQAEALSPDTALAVLACASRELADRVSVAHEKCRTFPVWQHWLWPSVESMTAQRAWRWIHEDVGRWEKARERLRNLILRVEYSPQIVFDLATVTPGGEVEARKFLAMVGLERAKALAAAEQAGAAAVNRVLKARASVVERLRTKQRELVRWVQDRLEPYVNRLLRKQENLISELKKAGVKVAVGEA
jgi:outer membrane lipoprotein SlyB